jgi:uncharacterized protein (TIGR00730 family)
MYDDEELEKQIKELLAETEIKDYKLAVSIIKTAVKLSGDSISRLDRKIVNTSLKEMRYAFRVFSGYRDVRKVTMFGSARASPKSPEYIQAMEFAARIVEEDWMVVTGAGPGIMEAGHAGAGGAHSFGVNIQLPFEAQANPFILGDPKLINFKYFFTRKLMFIKEANAFVVCPGGFGTMDEAFELLTLIQTGKSDLRPIVFLEPKGSKSWNIFTLLVDNFIKHGYIDSEDKKLYKITDNVGTAIAEIKQF